MTKTTRPSGWIVPLGGDQGAVAAALAAAGWNVRSAVDRSEVIDGEVPADTAVFLNAGATWQPAFDFLCRIRSPLTRACTVIVGSLPAKRPNGWPGREVRRHGGLTWWDAGKLSPWLLDPVRQAICRLNGPGTGGFADLLDGLLQHTADMPERVLLECAETLRKALGADAQVVAVDFPGAEDRFHGLVLGEDRPRWQRRDATDCGLRTPKDLCLLAHEGDQVVCILDLSHADGVLQAPGTNAFRACMAAPIVPRECAKAWGTPPAVIALYWKQPHLLVAPEIELVSRVCHFAASAWVRRPMRDQSETGQRNVARALFELMQPPALSPTVPSDGVPDLRAAVLACLEAGANLKGVRHLSVLTRAVGPSAIPAVTAGTEFPAVSECRSIVWSLVAERQGINAIDPGWRAEYASLHAELEEPPVGASDSGPASDRVASDGERAVNAVAIDLELAFLLHRRTSDGLCARSLAASLAGDADVPSRLQRMAGRVTQHLAADGLKLYMRSVLAGEPVIRQVFRTDRDDPGMSLPIDSGHGLGSRVLLTGKPLFIRHLVPAPQVLAPEPAWDGDAMVEVTAEPKNAHYAAAGVGDEAHQVLVPLLHQGEAAGVLSVWRKDPKKPFDPVLDISTLEQFAPTFAAACTDWSTATDLEAQEAAVHATTHALKTEEAPERAMRAALKQMLELAGCRHVALMFHDEDRLGHFYYGQRWSARENLDADVPFLRGLHLVARKEAGPYEIDLQQQLACRMPAGLALREVKALRSGEGDEPWGVVVLYDTATVVGHAAFDREVRQRSLRTFVAAVGPLLYKHLRAVSVRAIQALAKVPASSPKGVLAEVAAAVQLLFPDCAVLVYMRRSGALELVATSPNAQPDRLPRLLGFPSLAAKAMSDKRMLRIADLADKSEPMIRHVSNAEATTIATAMGWAQLRSIIAIPLTEEGQHSLGVLKVLTGAENRSLTSTHARVIEPLAQAAAHDVARLHWAAARRSLRELTMSVGGQIGRPLFEGLRTGLTAWATEYLASTTIALVARGQDGNEFFAFGPESNSQDFWVSLSRALEKGESVGTIAKQAFCVACPLELKGSEALGGHLFVSQGRKMHEAGLELVRQAAEEVSLLLHGDIIAREAATADGLQRHALLGPVQGLVSAIKAAEDIVDELGIAGTEDLQVCLRRARAEEATLMTWGDNQRTFGPLARGGELDVARNTVSLRDVVQVALRRYEHVFADKRMVIDQRWPGPGELHVRQADYDLLVVAISNLLDNAAKYAFSGTDLHLWVRIDREHAVVRVVDFGHPLPTTGAGQRPSALVRLFPRGGDPQRSIQGEGLGRFLIHEVARIHGGDVKSWSEPGPLQKGASPDSVRPETVTFEFSVRHNWR